MIANERHSVKDLATISLARLYVYLGWPGLLGLFLGLVACVIGVVLRMQMPLTVSVPVVADHVPYASSEPYERALAVTPPDLPLAAQQVDILKRIKAQVGGSGLAWPKADYKLVRLSDESLAHLEVRTLLKGPYPKLSQLITSLLDKEPALAMRELSLQRPNADSPDVEAKILFVVFLADDWLPAQAPAAP